MLKKEGGGERERKRERNNQVRFKRSNYCPLSKKKKKSNLGIG